MLDPQLQKVIQQPFDQWVKKAPDLSKTSQQAFGAGGSSAFGVEGKLMFPGLQMETSAITVGVISKLLKQDSTLEKYFLRWEAFTFLPNLQPRQGSTPMGLLLQGYGNGSADLQRFSRRLYKPTDPLRTSWLQSVS